MFSQDGRKRKSCVCLLPWPYQNHNWIIVEPSSKTTWRQAEQNFYSLRYKEDATPRLVGGVKMWNGLVPHLHLVFQNRELYIGCGGSHWRVRGSWCTPGSWAQRTSAGRRGLHNSWLWSQRGFPTRWDRKLLAVQASSSRAHAQSHLQTLPLSSSEGTVVWKVPVTYEEEMNCLVSGPELEGQLFWG